MFPWMLKWVVLFVSMYITALVMGILFSFGVLLDRLTDKYQQSLPKTVTVNSILVGVTLSSSVLSGSLASGFGLQRVSMIGAILCPVGFLMSFFAESIEYLYVSVGIISGFGISILFVCSTSAVNMVFSGSQRLLALSIQGTGINISIAILPYLINYLATTYGLQGTFLLIGGSYLNCIPAALVLAFANARSSPTSRIETNQNPEDENFSSLLKAITKLKELLSNLKNDILSVISVPYITSSLAVGVIIASLNGYILLITDIFEWKGFTESETLTAFPFTYGFGLVARLLPGILKQIKGINSMMLPIIYGLGGFLGQMMINFCTSKKAILAGVTLSGMTISGILSGASIFVAQITGPKSFSIGFGMIYTIVGVLSVISGPAYGVLKSTSESYDNVLLMTAGFQLFGTILLVATLIIRWKNNRQTDKHTVYNPRDFLRHELVRVG